MKAKRYLVRLYESIYSTGLVMGNLYRFQNRHSRLGIMNSDKTIDYIIKNEVSVSRFGEGELELILQERRDLGFQKHDSELSKRLEEVLLQKNGNCLICLPYAFNSIYGRTKHSRMFWYSWGRSDDKYKLTFDMINASRTDGRVFGDTQITRPYIAYKNASCHAKRIFTKLKLLWQDKDLLFVEGEQTRLGVGNDLFANARSIKRIIAPATNAFSSYNQILEKVKNLWNGELVLLALGPCATVLASDLSEAGIRAIDVGHLDIEYEWFLSGARGHDKIDGKFTNEADGGNVVAESVDEEYLKQIISRVGL